MNPPQRKVKIVALGLIENNDGKFLISQRFDEKVPAAHLKWDFLGGTNEFGESLETTVIREIYEETGLTVSVVSMFPQSSSYIWEHQEFSMHTLVFCFHCRYISGNTHLNDPKINDLKWIKKEQFKDFDFLPTVTTFIKDL